MLVPTGEGVEVVFNVSDADESSAPELQSRDLVLVQELIELGTIHPENGSARSWRNRQRTECLGIGAG
jgi:hypothetical protein